ncbi:MAG: C40 family peptidase [bacterium]
MIFKNTITVILRVIILVLLLAAFTGNLYARRVNHSHVKHTVKVSKHSKQKHTSKRLSPKKNRKHKKTLSYKKVSHVPRYRHVMNMRAKAFQASQTSADRAVNTALAFLGTPYSRGGISSRGMDCSGLVYRVMRDMGRDVPHNAAALSNTGIPVSRNQLKKGDLLFFHTTSARIGHVGIYTSNGNFVHASSGAGRVVVTPLSDEYYSNRLVGARRIFNNGGTPALTSHKTTADKHKKNTKHKHEKVSRKKPKLTKHKVAKKTKHKHRR